MAYNVTIDQIEQCIAGISSTADQYPGVVIIHDMRNSSIAWMSARGLKQLGINAEDIEGQSHYDYHNLYFNPDDAKDYVPKILGLLSSVLLFMISTVPSALNFQVTTPSSKSYSLPEKPPPACTSVHL